MYTRQKYEDAHVGFLQDPCQPEYLEIKLLNTLTDAVFSFLSHTLSHSLSSLPTFQCYVFPGPLQRLHRLVVRRVPQVHPVHRQDSVPDVQSLGLVRCEPFEDLTDEDGHFVLLPSFDTDPQTPDLLLGNLDAPLSVGDRFGHSLRVCRERGAHSLVAVVGVGVAVVKVRSVGEAVRVYGVVIVAVKAALLAA